MSDDPLQKKDIIDAGNKEWKQVVIMEFEDKIRKFVESNIPEVSYGISVSMDKAHENILTYTRGEIPELGFKYTDNTVYDFASLTKPLVTTTLVLKYLENGEIGLEDTLGNIGLFQETEPASQITIKSLITHTSGLQPDFPLYKYGRDKDSYQKLIGIVSQRIVINSREEYSDLNFILLGFILEEISGKKLDVLARDLIFKPLGMSHSSFNPAFSKELIAPTEQTEERGLVWGKVHDEKAYYNDGVAGHAGFFSNLTDTRKLVLSILDGEILSDSTRKLMWQPHTQFVHGTYGLGWIVKQPRPPNPSPAFGFSYFLGDYTPFGTVGHTGFTGTSICIEPETELFVIILSNRVYPTRDNTNILRFRRLFHNLVYSNLYKRKL